MPNARKDSKKSVKANGVKLYYTDGEYFNTSNLLSTTTISNDGYATFSNIHFDMKAGNVYLWITCDIADDVNHDLKNNIIDFMLEANSIDIGGAKYPSSDMNPSGQRLVCESIFFDDFENATKSNSIWTIESEFERGNALGLGGQGGNPDPSYAHSGSFILGTDLTGIGAFAGDYETGIDADSYTATTKAFDCHYYKDISLLYYRWLNVAGMDIASIGISTDGGLTWKNAWSSSSIMLDKEWSFQSTNLSKIADRSSNVKIRFSLGPTSSGLNYSGWNIDDVALVGTFVYYDLAVTDIVTPRTDCGYTTESPITIKIKNIGYNDVTTPFIASYSIVSFTSSRCILAALNSSSAFETSLRRPSNLRT